MRTTLILVGGLLLLGLCVLLGRWLGGATQSALADAALCFIPIWFFIALGNMWVGVARAGYSVAEEMPIFLLIFALPAAAALLVRWMFTRA